MFYRQAAIRHTSYEQTKSLYPIAFDKWLLIVLLVIAVTAPYWMSGLYLNSYMLPWIIWSTAALSLNLLMGFAGQIHLGYGAVMAIGAYASVHAAQAGIPFEIALILGGVTAMLIGVGFGFTALRVKGLYLAISTLAVQYLVDWVVSHVPAIGGGTQATLQTPTPSILGFDITTDAGRYYIAFAWCAFVTIFLLNVKRTGLGRALIAVREKDYAASVIGVNSYYYKLIAFAVSSFFGGVTGAILAFTYFGAVTPEQYSIDVSIQILAMVVVGGLGSILGSFFGAGFILLTPIFLGNIVAGLAESYDLGISRGVISHIPLILYGGLIMGFLLFEPLGLAKIYDNVRKYLLVWPFGFSRR